MPTYYTHFSFHVPITEAERLWVNVTLDEMEEREFDYELRDDHVWIHGDTEGAGSPDRVAEFLTEWLRQPFSSHKVLGFQWAYTCSRPVTDGFGGGAARLRIDPDSRERVVELERFDTNFFLEEWSVP